MSRLDKSRLKQARAQSLRQIPIYLYPHKPSQEYQLMPDASLNVFDNQFGQLYDNCCRDFVDRDKGVTK